MQLRWIPRVAWSIWALIALLLVLGPSNARAADGFLLVATPEQAGHYARTVIAVTTYKAEGDGERYLGLLLNKPTNVQLAELFPAFKPAAKFKEPVYVGGPVQLSNIFVVYRGKPPVAAKHPHGVLPMIPGVVLALEADVIDGIIE